MLHLDMRGSARSALRCRMMFAFAGIDKGRPGSAMLRCGIVPVRPI
jgi:hypothetical protein